MSRRTQVKSLAVAAGTAMVLFAVGACSSPSTGSPAPTTSNSSTDSTTSTPDGSSALPADQPCSLLSSADLQQLGVSTPPSQDQTGNSETCEITLTNGSATVGVQKAGLAQLVVVGPVTSVKIGNHAAKQMQDPTSGGCLVAIGISASSRVDVSVNADADSQACSLASSVAGLIEPHLPAAG